MATVLVHNTAWPNERQARSTRRSARAVRREHWWNLWKIRQAPYQILADGMPILLLNSWPGGGVIRWLVRARDVHVGDFPDKDAAVRAIARWAGQTHAWVMSDPYTAGRPGGAGKAIYWRASPVSGLDLSKPQLAVRRNGWLVVDHVEASSWGADVSGLLRKGRSVPPAPAGGRRSGQGLRLDVATKRAIEARAMAVAKAWCRRRRWTTVRNVSSTESWDLEAYDAAARLRYVEVKGTTGDGSSVEVTRCEVDAARRHGDDHPMVIVHGIQIDLNGPKPVASGGIVSAYDPWRPRAEELIERRFTWAPAQARTPALSALAEQ